MGAKKHFMEIDGMVDIKDTNNVLIVKKNIHYKTTDLLLYKSYFEEFKEECVIKNCNFEEDKWYLKTHYATLNLNFSRLDNSMKNPTKAFILVGLKFLKHSTITSKHYVERIDALLNMTDNLSLEKVVDFRESIQHLNNNKIRELMCCKYFLLFYHSDNSIPYLEILSNLSRGKDAVRSLPHYKSFFMFDQIINDFQKSENQNEKNLFLPILIWWKLSTIIPIRPIELMKLKNDCVNFSDGNYYITIDRQKISNKKFKTKKLQVINSFCINKELFDLIQEYVCLKEIAGEFLFSYKVYSQCLKENASSSKSYLKEDSSIFSVYDLNYLRRLFFKKVIEGKYSLKVVKKGEEEPISDNEIEEILLGDTRHFAFCSLILQGLNPLTIAQLGGHQSLNQQFSYYCHLNSFVDAQTFVLAKNISQKIKVDGSSYNLSRNIKKGLIAKKTDPSYHNCRSIENGKCMSKNFPMECICDNCLYCKYFILDGSANYAIIKQEKIRINKEIDAKLNLVKDFIKSSLPSSRDGDLSSQNSNELKTKMNEVDMLIKKEILLKAQEIKIKEVENNE